MFRNVQLFSTKGESCKNGILGYHIRLKKLSLKKTTPGSPI